MRRMDSAARPSASATASAVVTMRARLNGCRAGPGRVQTSPARFISTPDRRCLRTKYAHGYIVRVNDNDRHAIAVHAIGKRFGAIRALDGVDLEVPPGTVCAVLGPNGAGKTTLVRILTTLLRPDFGTARVAGCDVVRDAERLRYRIGLAGQYAAVDGLLTGRDNLIM